MGVLFLNLRNGSKGVPFLIQVFLIRGEGGVLLVRASWVAGRGTIKPCIVIFMYCSSHVL